MFYGHGTGTPWFEAGRAIEESVFCHTLHYTPELVREEYEPYDDVSIQIVLANLHEGAIVGSIRALVCESDQLKIAEDLQHRWGVDLADSLVAHGIDPTVGLVECATISVLPAWRRADANWPIRALCASFGQLVLDVGGSWCIQLQDLSGPRLLGRLLGLPFEILADLPPVDFLGPVVPTISHVAHYHKLFAGYADRDLMALFLNRDVSVRGGTLLPVIDLTAADYPTLLPTRATQLGG